MTTAPRLGVNIDHIATVRQARRAKWPDPIAAATMAELAGADQITLHLREDRRHIQDRDVFRMREAVQTKMNLEMAATAEMLAIACQTKPDVVTLVPEKRQELTTEGGLDVVSQRKQIAEMVAALTQSQIPTSLFVDPDETQIRAAKETDAFAIEIHTGTYCEAKGQQAKKEAARILYAARYAKSLGLEVYAGHGLDYHNIGPIAQVAEIEEFNIGYSIVSRALFVGLGQAVKEMKDLLRMAQSS